MISAIFKPEVSTLESQVAALQAQIAAHTERISLLNETELLAGDSLEALKGAIEKVSSLAPDAIASLKSAVMSLFTGNDSDDGGVEVAIAPLEEPLNGQLCELSSPYCQLPEDAPRIELETACTVSDVPQPYVELIPVTHTTAYQRSQDGEIICAYLGGNNKSRLKDWGSWLCNQHSVGSGFELREALRMTAYKWELKIWGMSLKQVVRLSETDTTKSVPSRYHVASFPVAAHLLQTDEDAPQEDNNAQVIVVTDRDVEEIPATVVCSPASQPESLMFQVGDRVEVISDRHGVELVGTSGIVTAGTASGAAVNVNGTLRWFCSDEVTLTSSSPTPRNAADDLFPTTPAPTIAPAYNANPIGRGGAVANWKARTLGGIGVNLKDCGTGGITSLAEWQRIEAEQKAQKALAATASTADNEPEF